MAEGGTKLDLSCSICFEEYDTPKVLPCGHTFCCQCLSKMLDKHLILMYLKCPKCRTEVPLPESGKIGDLPTNFELKDIIEDQSQKENGKKGATTQPEDACSEPWNQCLVHETPPEFYCKSCKLQVCAQCLLGEHKPSKHDIEIKSDFAHNLLVEVQKLGEKLKEVKTKEVSLGDKIVESEVLLEQQYSKIKAEINRKVAEEQEKIQRKGDTLLKELADKKTANLHLITQLKTQHSSLSSLSNQTEANCTLLRQEFIKFNFSGECKLVEVSKGIETLDEQIQSLGKTCDKKNTTEVDFHLHDTFQWDLGKLISTADEERLQKAAGATREVHHSYREDNYDDHMDDYDDDYRDDYYDDQRDDYYDEQRDDYYDDQRDDYYDEQRDDYYDDQRDAYEDDYRDAYEDDYRNDYEDDYRLQ